MVFLKKNNDIKALPMQGKLPFRWSSFKIWILVMKKNSILNARKRFLELYNIKPDVISSRNFEEIASLAREAVNIMLGFKLAYLGINEDNPESALLSARLLSRIFNFSVKEGKSSVFVGSGFEVMKKK